MNAILVFFGGGLGALARYGLNSAISRLLPMTFPLGIFFCNVLGSFLMGLGTGYASKLWVKDSAPWFGPFALIGFLGGFTTFSTFANDNYQLLREGRSDLALTSMILSLLGSLGAVVLGFRLAES